MAKNTDTPAETPRSAETVHSEGAAAQEDASRAQIWAFWGVVALAVIAARALNYLLPGVSESVIERWVMLGFGACMGLFLLKLK
ncbi:MAG TPA: hypothetical protein DCW72_00015 [Elusimicrobia bacterium]|nr:MAG: hypothetical protein A2X29_03915 [Elusimicrobia bacterium GWA2_64_40]OGR63194.1 MAG: hypothetical protein A2X30_02615 [Elusimicrobia bacterium GWB2_63_16]HAN04360.1 hypothetical protein [Elusimicrobiota bacterium]HAU88663.1 hypothetical protein [Elusimicrobiota bacterium]